jgi:hypothetical protein
MKNPLYGCPTCGRIGWSRSGERVDGAGEEGATPLVRKDSRGGGTGSWVGDCGHPVPVGSALARSLDSLQPHDVGALASNRDAEMGDWRPSATR